MDLDKIAEDLYALPTDEFTAARDAQVSAARKAKDSELAAQIKALGKPTQTAWIVNQLVRHRPKVIRQLLDLGRALREAQQNLAGPELKKLSGQRRTLLQELAHESRELAQELGHPISASAEQEVASTLGAALADAELAEQLRSGRLTKALDFSSFGDLKSLAAPAPKRAAKDDTKARIAKLEKAQEKAARALAEAETERDGHRERATHLREQLARLEEQLQSSEHAVKEARAQLDDVEAQLDELTASDED